MRLMSLPNSTTSKVVLAAAAVVFILSVGCATGNEQTVAQDDRAPNEQRAAQDDGAGRQTSVRPPPVSASEFHNFDSFPEMVATSEVTIIGEVAAQLDGYTVGDHGEVKYLNFEFDVVEVLAGRIDTRSFVLEIVEPMLAYGGDATWTEPGERSVLFLEKNEVTLIEAPSYRLVNSQGVYQIVGEDRLEGPRDNDEFIQRVAAWSISDLRARVEGAKTQIELGEVQSQPHLTFRQTPPDGEASLVTDQQPGPGLESSSTE